MPRKRIIPKNNLVIGKIRGGLGNQLFIIFTTIAYSLENNIEYGIVDVERVRKTYFDTPLYKNLKVNNKNLHNFKNFNENGFSYNPIPKENNIILNGYFQSYKYFDKYKEKILEMLDIMKCREEIGEYDGFLHFRIGDYKNTECHPICDLEYYENSLKDIEKDNDKKLKFIYYFEEEDRKEIEEKINIIREKFKNFTFTPIDTKILDYKQMLSMTKMKYCIIANSTFSWWGAYLNQTPGKKVFYPKKWFVGTLKNYNTNCLILREWKKEITRNAYVLTLDKNSERAIFVKNILENIGFNVILFKVIRDEFPTISHRKSMYAIYEKIIKEEKGYCYVFEDDVNTLLDIDLDYIVQYEKLEEDIASKRSVGSLKSESDIIYLGYCYNEGKMIKTDKKINGDEMYKISGGVRGLHSLAINKKGAQILKKIFDDNDETVLMDVLLEKYTLENPLFVARKDLISPCHSKHFGIFYQDRFKFESQLENCKYY